MVLDTVKQNDFKTFELLSRLKELGVELRADNDKLHIDAPKGVLSASLREELSQRKADILRFLAESVQLMTHDMMALQPVSRNGALPLSFSQERLWFLSQLEPENVAYNISGEVRLVGRVQIEILNKTLSEIIRRHEILRTTFNEIDGKPVQVVLPPSPFNLQIMDLQGLSEADRKERARRIAIEEARRPFDLSRGPLFRATLVILGVEESFLIISMHHIITDRWSLGVFARELGVLYQAFSRGKPSPLAELPIQYADFAAWQRQRLNGENLSAQVEYWKNKLGDEIPILQLPTDRPRSVGQTYNGTTQLFNLPAGISEKLKILSQRRGVTLFMTLLAALKALLYRYTGQTDFAVGSPIANRNRTELEGLIGFFVNTLVLCTDLSGDPRFVELLGRVRETTLGAYDHQDTPFEKLVEILNPVRDMSYSPLFQVMFVLQNIPVASGDLQGFTFTETGASMFDLTLYMWEEEKGLFGQIEYNTDVFHAKTIERMVGNFRTLLESVVDDPNRRLSELAILTEPERHQSLISWNATETAYPADKTLVQLFEEQADRTPEVVAVVFEGEQLTYRQLNRRANQLAHFLRSLGVGPESRVGIWLERSIEMIVGLLGILKAGGAYVPLDPSYPKERLASMLKDAQVPVLLTGEKFLGNLPEYAGRVVCIDGPQEDIAGGSKENPVTRIGPDNAAYVIYTSGSTGMPNGVVGLHRGAVNRLNWMWKTYPFNEREVCCQKTYLSFVDSVWEIFGPLLQGVSTVIIPDDAVKDPVLLVQTLAASHVSRIVLVPSLLRVLLDAFSDLQARLPELRMWTTSGEEIPLELARRFRQAVPEARLINLYGSSEVSADVTCHEITDTHLGRSVPIGRPIHNTQIYLLDAHLQPVPVGVHAEIYVGGAGVARGYLNRPDLTAERFIPNPFREEDVLFKTGDLARCLPDGTIEYLGRKDHQVKIRGFRIEPGEIETALRQHPAIGDAVVASREDGPGDKQLGAYVVPQKGSAPSASELRSFLRGRLPDYMVPSAFIFLDSMPLTPSGKIDVRKFESLRQFQTERSGVSDEPLTEMEKTLVDIWKEALELDSISVHDNFFELGGHSLLTIQVITHLEKKIGLRINPREFFYQTLGQVAASIEKQKLNPAPKRGEGEKAGFWNAIKRKMLSGNHRK